MSVDRTPEEWAEAQAEDALIRKALADAHDDLVSMFLADGLDLDATTCDDLVDRMYVRLKNALTPQMRARAIFTLLGDRALRDANEQLRELRDLPERGRSL